MTSERSSLGHPVLLGARSLSIGWGIRGNLGHEYGALIPEALAALASCQSSPRRGKPGGDMKLANWTGH